MDAGMYKSVRTKLEPWDWMPNARGAVRTQIRPEDLDPHAKAVRTQVRPEDLNPRMAAVRTTVRAGELQGPVIGAGLSTEKRHEELTKQAERLVAQTFFGTLLKQMRNSPFKSELFSGGRGGEAFASMYDERLAERMAHGAGRRLAESIVKHLQARDARRAKKSTESRGQENSPGEGTGGQAAGGAQAGSDTQDASDIPAAMMPAPEAPHPALSPEYRGEGKKAPQDGGEGKEERPSKEMATPGGR